MFVPDATGLAAQLFIEKLRHQFQSFLRVGKFEVIPERVRQRLKDDKLRVVAAAKQGAVKDRCLAQEHIARAGDKKSRRHVGAGRQRAARALDFCDRF